MTTASFNLETHETLIYAGFVYDLEQAGLKPETALRGICTHEVGHYCVFPHDLGTYLFLQAIAHDKYEQEKNALELTANTVNLYADIVNNLNSLAGDRRSPWVAQIYRALNKEHKTLDYVPAVNLDRVIANIYQHTLSMDLGIKLTKDEQALFSTMLNEKNGRKHISIDFTQNWAENYRHATSLLIFTDCIKETLKETFNAAKKAPKQDPAKMLPELELIAQEVPRYQLALDSIWPAVLADYVYPLIKRKPRIVMSLPIPGLGGEEEGSIGGIGKYSDQDINDALDGLIRKHGKPMYEHVRDFLRKTRPGFKDRFPPPSNKPKGAGIEGVDKIEWNNDQVPYYERLATTYPVYIARKPLKHNAEDLYPSEQKPFEIGDETSKLNPWSAPKIMPGISTRWQQAKGKRTIREYRVPDLFVMLDTSGSMPHPRYMSNAVLATIVLGRNYHANGSRVGIGNFSSDIMLLPPTRDLDLFNQAACAYWGGGTVLNTEKIKDWFQLLQRLGDERVKELKDVVLSTEEDYRKLLEKLDVVQRKEFEEKHLELKLDEKPPEIYERVDNILITDGAIYNLKDVVGYLNSIAEQTRNTVFIINSKQEYEAWKQLGLERTTIYNIEKPEDLLNKSIERARATADTEQEQREWG